jgi:Reverse transcriptase (RNA-dependent DNA polymerase)
VDEVIPKLDDDKGIAPEEVRTDINQESTTRSGRNICKPMRYQEDFDAIMIDDVYTLEAEALLVGAAIGEGIGHTGKLQAAKYKEAMSGPEKEKWIQAIEQEHNRMIQNSVWMPVKLNNLPPTIKPLLTTWVLKKKVNGDFRARITAQGFLQEEGVHFRGDSTSAPVTNETTIKLVLILLTLADWEGHVIDVKGAFLKSQFNDGEEMYLQIPQGFEIYYNTGIVLKLQCTIYGLKQAALAFWRELLIAFNAMGFQRSSADPCLYYKNSKNGIVIWISMVDDCLLIGHRDDVSKYKAMMHQFFECEDIGKLKEYVGCKIERNKENQSLKISQPVIIQSFEDEYGVKPDFKLETPASHGDTFIPGEVSDQMSAKKQKVYCSGVGKFLHLSKWIVPDIQNITRELSWYFMTATLTHDKAMRRVMTFCLNTKNRALPKGEWNGKLDENYFFEIAGVLDSNYAKDMQTRKSVSGYATFLNGAL